NDCVLSRTRVNLPTKNLTNAQAKTRINSCTFRLKNSLTHKLTK
ncbi:hypothetical protein HMPREF1991_03025, partial [Hoylesella loescheii DSM 19665 = JCM 12249 = ATCC 15930]